MILGAILSPVVALLMGMAIATLLWPSRRLTANLLTKLSLATGLGLGATSCLAFLFLAATNGRLAGLPAAEIVALAALVMAAVVRRSAEKPALACAAPGPWRRAAPAAALGIFLLAAAAFALTSASHSHGDWDAWSLWNLHARFLYRGGERWTDLFSAPMAWSHPDYPLMLPASVMRAWVYAGGETVLGPILIAFVFAAGATLLLYCGLALLRGRLRAALATVLLASTPFFMPYAASQYADVPLAFFCLATLVLLCLADGAGEGRGGLLALAGLTAGLAAWTKNEGLLFLLCVLVARSWTLCRTGGARTWWRRMRPFLAGLLPMALVLLFFKLRYAPPNDILGAAGRAGALDRLLTPSRYLAIGAWLLKQSFAFGRWDELAFLPISPVPLLLAALLLFGIQPETKRLEGPRTAAWTLGLMLAGYLVILLITPAPLEWQLEQAGPRLLLHLWPGALFVCFLVLRGPAPDPPPVSKDAAP